MNRQRIFALIKKDLKTTAREPALLFILILFPIALTVAFGGSFGALGSSQMTVYQVGVVNQDATGQYSQWSSQFVAGLNATKIINMCPYTDSESAQADLQQGRIQALIIIPGSFGESCNAYQNSPNSPGLWLNSTLMLSVDSGSMFAMQAIPPIIHQVLSATAYSSKQTTFSGPIQISDPAMVQTEKLSAFDYMVPGIFAFASIFLIMSVSGSFTGERENGLLRRLSTTPTSSGDVMVSKTLSNVMLACGQVAVVFAMTFAMGFHSSGNWLNIGAAFAIVAVFSICNVGFGLMAATLSRSAGAATGIAFIFVMPQMFLGTFVTSTATQTVGKFVPSHYVTDALTSLLLRGAPISSPIVIMDFSAVVLVSIAALLTGIFLFKRYGRI